MQIERLDGNAWQRLKAVRLRSLADAPDAFGSTLADAQGLVESDWRQQLDSLATFIAVFEGADVGLARGVVDDADEAWLVSMWVAPEARGTGAGERLIEAVVEPADLAWFQSHDRLQ